MALDRAIAIFKELVALDFAIAIKLLLQIITLNRLDGLIVQLLSYCCQIKIVLGCLLYILKSSQFLLSS